MKKISFFVLSLVFSVACFGQDSLQTKSTQYNVQTQEIEEATKAEGDSAYIKNDYATAIQIYENILQKGESAEIYYNLGNSYYKMDEIAKAILNYERALLLQPGNNDIRTNLDIARSKTIDKIETVPEFFLLTWMKKLLNCMSVDAWGGCAVLFYFLLLVSLCFFIFSNRISWKKIGFVSGILFLFLAVVSNVFALQQKERLTDRNAAIIMAPSVVVRSTPNESGTSLFILHEGSKVEIEDNAMKEWKEIRLEDGKVGWLPSNAIEII